MFFDIQLTKVANTVLNLMGTKEDTFDKPIEEVLLGAKECFDGPCDRVLMYNPDGIASWISDTYKKDLAPLESTVDVTLPMLSIVPPVTPVCFASMYSGVLPEVHGIKEYAKPVLSVKTIFDVLPKIGKKVAIVSENNCSISMIFLNRPVDYFTLPSVEECNQKAKELIEQDIYDVIILYNGNYDAEMHHHGPKGKLAHQALKENISTYLELAELIKKHWSKHNTALSFCPDHGCHKVGRSFGSHGINEESDMNIYHYWKFIPKQS